MGTEELANAVREMAQRKAKLDALRYALSSWRERSKSVATERDPLVLAALAAGFTIEGVHGLTGLGRSTIERIIQRNGQREEGQS
jgi:DNA invertase Pin-like site-specific DNA recombinase